MRIGQKQIEEPAKTLVVDPLAASLLQLRFQQVVTITWMLPYDLAQPGLEYFLIRINGVIPLFPIPPGSLGQGERFATLIETVLMDMIPCQGYLLVHRQRSLKKLLNRATSTFVLPTIRYSSDTSFS